jgi:hypothetical protein
MEHTSILHQPPVDSHLEGPITRSADGSPGSGAVDLYVCAAFPVVRCTALAIACREMRTTPFVKRCC